MHLLYQVTYPEVSHVNAHIYRNVAAEKRLYACSLALLNSTKGDISLLLFDVLAHVIPVACRSDCFL